MISFNQFWPINENMAIGSYPLTLYKGENGYFTGNESDEPPSAKIFLKKDQLPTNLQTPGQAAVYAIANNAAARTDLLHLFRFKHNSLLSTTLSWNAVNRLVYLIKQRVQEQSKLGNVKIVYPKSESPFNDLVKRGLEEQIPQVSIIELSKKNIHSIPSKEFMPFEGLQRKDKTVTDRIYKLIQYVHFLYDDYLKTHPEAKEFSKDALTRELNEHNKQVGERINQKVGLSPKEMADLQKYGYYEIARILAKTPVATFQSKEEIQPGDRVIVFDDNTSTGFTEQQIKKTLGPKVLVPYCLYGLKVLGPV